MTTSTKRRVSAHAKTKVEAVVMFLKDMEGHQARWASIYQGIGRYYPNAKKSEHWQEGIRGVVYREIRNGRTFTMISKGVIGLR